MRATGGRSLELRLIVRAGTMVAERIEKCLRFDLGAVELWGHRYEAGSGSVGNMTGRPTGRLALLSSMASLRRMNIARKP